MKNNRLRIQAAFTLIELLVVVAVIAVLAAIAIPNLLEAQVRAKVARTKADMRTVATGLQAYAVDYNHFPLCNNEMLAGKRPESDAANGAERFVLERLSTPVAYLSVGIVEDPFKPGIRLRDFTVAQPQGSTIEQVAGDGDMPLHHRLKYGAMNPHDAVSDEGFADVVDVDGPAPRFILYSSGPDGSYTAPKTIMQQAQQVSSLISCQFYDPTNGTASFGDVWRVGGAPLSPDGWGSEFWRQASHFGG
jgi:prepilin-type N-terminal cleavage/methylation domain-containing protein